MDSPNPTSIFNRKAYSFFIYAIKHPHQFSHRNLPTHEKSSPHIPIRINNFSETIKTTTTIQNPTTQCNKTDFFFQKKKHIRKLSILRKIFTSTQHYENRCLRKIFIGTQLI